MEETERVIFSYNGEMNNAVLNNILYTIENKMVELNEKPAFIKKVNSVLIECCQNLIHHPDKSVTNPALLPALLVTRKDGAYTITTRNIVTPEVMNKLKNYIDMLNAMNPDELRKYYNEVLTNGQISSKGGGGLGIINIIRKTKDTRINYVFESISPNQVFYNMSATI